MKTKLALTMAAASLLSACEPKSPQQVTDIYSDFFVVADEISCRHHNIPANLNETITLNFEDSTYKSIDSHNTLTASSLSDADPDVVQRVSAIYKLHQKKLAR